jgi:hypothetical protein
VSEADRISTVDRRGHAAGVALDQALGDPVPPQLPVPAGRNGTRWTPLLVAAALVVVALAAAAFLAPSSDEGTVAGEGERLSGTTRVVVDKPEEVDLTVRAAGHGRRDSDMDFGAASVHVPDGDWGRAVIVTTSDFVPGMFQGLVVDVGPTDAVLHTHDAGGVLWRDGTRTYAVAAAGMPDDMLIDVASDAVAAGWNGNGPLPGHQQVFAGSSVDTQPTFEPTVLPPGAGAVAYQHGDGLVFTVSWQPGSETRWRSELVHGVNQRNVQVDGRDAVAAEYRLGTPLHVASWVEPDGTIVRVGTYGDLNRALDLVDGRLTSLDEAGFARLVAENLQEPGVGMFPYEEAIPAVDYTDRENPWGVPTGGDVLASVAADDGNTTFRVGVTQTAEGIVTLHVVTMTASGNGGGSSTTVPGFDRPVMQASQATTTGDADPLRMVGGIVPDGWTVSRVVDRTTGETLPVVTERTAPADEAGSTAVLTVVAVDGFDETPLEVVFLNGNGVERRYWL